MCATRRQVGGGEGDVKKSRVTRKHVLIAAVSLVIMALVVVGVVESVRIFSKHNVEVLKVFSQSVSQSVSQSINQSQVFFSGDLHPCPRPYPQGLLKY